MRVAALQPDGHIAIEERPQPSADADHVVMRVSSCALPTAAVLAVRENRGAAGSVYGNDFVGRIVEVGPSVHGFAIGDRVASVITDVASPVEGGLAEFAAVHPSALVKLPDAIVDIAAADLSTAAMAVQAVAESRAHVGCTVCIVGCGPLGLAVLSLVKGVRPAAVFVVEPLAARRELAMAAGATRAFSREERVADFFLELAAGGADVVFDCAGQRNTLQFASFLARGGGGQVVMAAWYDGPDGIDPNAVIKETDIRGSIPRMTTVEQVLAGMGHAALDTTTPTRTIPLDAVDSVFTSLWTPDSADFRVVVAPTI